MSGQDLCDNCCSRKYDSPLIEATLSVLAGFDATGQRVFKPKDGKWCDWYCMRDTMRHYWTEAYKEAQRKMEHEEANVLAVTQRLRDHETQRRWEQMQSEVPMWQRMNAQIRFFVRSRLYQPLRIRYAISRARWQYIPK